ncbi:type I-C CRISPR-associated protein Cas8c/Csd1 [Tautonia sociabilis]|uniref:Type I-C CRISPR-associated protein Cas8c/Csd1 n=1 Tax=Tautonia sociabilis TaxID=2080755 RepID=A0A432ME63_9BACT|nr:type I-C CRISPR-associated protein Cas8c/Csd1 [Tautonia sociabilis]RUL83504.1 type I-C CRISPR-associated protein Cas8c/Csd1 [Tautonia sociabilis]
MSQTHPTSGLLPALIAYYHRLEADQEQSNRVADFGFSEQKIHAQVVLEPDGSLSAIEDIRERSERGQPRPRLMVVPDHGGRSGTGLKPYFCWDNTGYVLGRDTKGSPKRSAAMFAAFRDLHLSFRAELVDDEGYEALCRFLEHWDPANAESLPNWDELAGLNVVFKLRAWPGYVHQSAMVRDAWSRRLTADTGEESGPVACSLISGEPEQLARLHPAIKGVVGANTTGAALVSFNLDAFESYGKSQSYNAPVGIRDAFRYTTALNRLLADTKRQVRIGDATVVFWSDQVEGANAEELFHDIFLENTPAEDAATVDRVRGFLNDVRQGRLSDRFEHPDAPFYVLGLSPNASRLNVRYWLVGTVRQFAERLAEHVDRLRMIGERADAPPPIIRRLLLETAREPKDIPPQLAGEVARAVLGGLPYPQLLFNAVLRRIRADSQINLTRAAILKAYLINNIKKEVSVALNKDHPDEAYQIGRLFATLEKTQEDARQNKLNKTQEDASQNKLNATIKDRFFASAAATPANVFPRLLHLHQHHMRNLDYEGQRIDRERLMDEIMGRINHFPRHLPLERQGLFYIGYYHQRQDFFTKKTVNAKETTNE